MESQAPPAPAPQSPETGAKTEQLVRFDWADVINDSPPVTYILQVATSKDFTADSIVWEKARLTASEYTLTETEKLATVRLHLISVFVPESIIPISLLITRYLAISYGGSNTLVTKVFL